MLFIPILISSIDGEDDRAFMAQLYIDHRVMMYRIAMKTLRNHHDTEDAMNNTFVALMRNIATIKNLSGADLVKYISKATTNSTLNIITKRNREVNRTVTYEDALENVGGTERVEDRILQESDIASMLKVMDKLPPAELNILKMKYLCGESDEAIADTFGIRPGTVRSHLSHARSRVKLLLEKEGLV